ncbi:hypothetical protein MIR68_001888 [Amoeboaphelidium protococcarum]|nr:hypothetical protein MIR68_001888 [Amoeboaphelidium protococcarum]
MLEQELKPERDVKKSASQVLGDTEIQHTQPASERFALLALVCQNEGNQSDPEAVWNVLSESGILDGFDFNLLAFQREATSDQAEDCQQVPSQPAQDIVVQELQRDFGNNAADLQEPAQDDVDEFCLLRLQRTTQCCDAQAPKPRTPCRSSACLALLAVWEIKSNHSGTIVMLKVYRVNK